MDMPPIPSHKRLLRRRRSDRGEDRQGFEDYYRGETYYRNKVWNCKSKRFISRYGKLGKRIISSNKEPSIEPSSHYWHSFFHPETDINEFLCTPLGEYVLGKVLLSENKEFVDESFLITFGDLRNYFQFYLTQATFDHCVEIYVKWYISNHHFRATRNVKKRIPPSKEIYITRNHMVYNKDTTGSGGNECIVNFFNTDKKIKLTFPLNIEDILLFCPSNKKNLLFEERNKNVDIYLVSNEDSWRDIPPEYLVELGKNFPVSFDLRWILKAIEAQLNFSRNNNPAPAFPFIPSTREKLSSFDLFKLYQLHNSFVNKSVFPEIVKIFLFDTNFWMTQTSYEIVHLLEIKGMRFSRLPEVDSQKNFTGRWVPSTCPMSEFELMFDKWMRTNDIGLYHLIFRTYVRRGRTTVESSSDSDDESQSESGNDSGSSGSGTSSTTTLSDEELFGILLQSLI